MGVSFLYQVCDAVFMICLITRWHLYHRFMSCLN